MHRGLASRQQLGHLLHLHQSTSALGNQHQTTSASVHQNISTPRLQTIREPEYQSIRASENKSTSAPVRASVHQGTQHQYFAFQCIITLLYS